MASTSQKFIVGASISSIATDLRLDHGWPRLRVDAWQDDDGDTVVYLSRAEQLDAHGRNGVLVYLAPGFDQRDNWWALDDAMRRRDCERIEL